MTTDILKVFEAHRMAPTAIDEYESGGREKLTAQMETFVASNKPLQFVMLGYPFKSTNHVHKTIGVLPDLAEELSLKNFQQFASEVSNVYGPGAHITLASDGYVFNDLLSEFDSVVAAYGEVTADMAKNMPVQLVSLRDFYPADHLATARDKVMQQFGITDLELERRILVDANVNALYRGMVHFMEEELAYKEFSSRNQLHKSAKKLARSMMERNEAYSHLVASEFPNHIRLSMHPATNNGTKYSFQLIPSPKARFSPWHCVLLLDSDGQYATVHRMDAESAGHTLMFKDGRPYYYRAQ